MFRHIKCLRSHDHHPLNSENWTEIWRCIISCQWSCIYLKAVWHHITCSQWLKFFINQFSWAFFSSALILHQSGIISFTLGHLPRQFDNEWMKCSCCRVLNSWSIMLISISANAQNFFKLIFILTFGVFVAKLGCGIKMVSRMGFKSCIYLLRSK